MGLRWLPQSIFYSEPLPIFISFNFIGEEEGGLRWLPHFILQLLSLSHWDMIFKCRKYFLCKSSAKGSATQSQYANGHNTDSCVVYQKWSLLSQLLGVVLAITQCSSLVECKNCYPAYVVYRTLTTLYNTIGTLLCLQIAQQPFIAHLLTVI